MHAGRFSQLLLVTLATAAVPGCALDAGEFDVCGLGINASVASTVTTTVAVGQSARLDAMAWNCQDPPVPASAGVLEPVTWRSRNEQIASVRLDPERPTATGTALATAHTPGTVVIEARMGAATGTVTLTVVPAPATAGRADAR